MFRMAVANHLGRRRKSYQRQDEEQAVSPSGRLRKVPGVLADGFSQESIFHLLMIIDGTANMDCITAG